eukprot:TRINITY_DN11750_c0_g1_i5.p1 TRINITY_DN11750_c0_g1~~TRINITY_DN11750_c0_g1_i5.p1  ORF type:complete len:109 (+),score=33.48 TRINITY_DN11750_c0_g1_i5:259-585(+)
MDVSQDQCDRIRSNTESLNAQQESLNRSQQVAAEAETRAADVLENLRAQRESLQRSRAKNKPVSYTHLRAHETPEHLVCRLLLEKKKKTTQFIPLTQQTSFNMLSIIR